MCGLGDMSVLLALDALNGDCGARTFIEIGAARATPVAYREPEDSPGNAFKFWRIAS